jgi:hypothetical protein
MVIEPGDLRIKAFTKLGHSNWQTFELGRGGFVLSTPPAWTPQLRKDFDDVVSRACS